jgi:hypothetical protein
MSKVKCKKIFSGCGGVILGIVLMHFVLVLLTWLVIGLFKFNEIASIIVLILGMGTLTYLYALKSSTFMRILYMLSVGGYLGFLLTHL